MTTAVAFLFYFFFYFSFISFPSLNDLLLLEERLLRPVTEEVIYAKT